MSSWAIEPEMPSAFGMYPEGRIIRVARSQMTIPHFFANRPSGQVVIDLANSPRQRSSYTAELAAVDNVTSNRAAPITRNSHHIARSRGSDTDVIQLDTEPDIDDLNNELQMTGVLRVKKDRKHVKIPRVLDPRRKGVHVKRIAGPILRPGTVVEFADRMFMKIKKVYEDRKEGHLLIGHMFARATTYGMAPPDQRDGLVWKQTKTSNDPDTRLPLSYKGGVLVNEVIQKIGTAIGENKADYGLWRRSSKDIRRTRHLHITNQTYNDINCLTSRHISATNNATIAGVETTGSLYCRWKDITIQNRDGTWQKQLERPSNDECDEDWTDELEKQSEAWRGFTTPLKYDTDPVLFCDGYCGAGGVSSGAQQAGLSIALSFDKDPNKIATFSANFPNCESLAVDASKFIELAHKHGWRVDVLHLSPPCQPYSRVNTTPNQEKNEQNQTPLLACSDIIRALRPRVVTIEETPDIVTRHNPWFHALLHQFTELGFSLRWSILKCSDYGVPQLRQRLFIIAAAPGEELPPFPPPTHAPGTVSIATALRDLDRANRASPLTHHDTSALYPVPKPPFDRYTLAKTITCGGGLNYHPDGTRQYTVREFAALQTFPLRYLFGKTEKGESLSVTELRAQIGNAVPPLVAQAIFTSVVKSLREHDKRRLARTEAEAQENIVVLDD